MLKTMTKTECENMINWCELSRLLAGNRSSITKKRISKKHHPTIERLKELIKQWDDERCTAYNAS